MDSRKEDNKKLVEKYPFLLPREAYSGKKIKDYDYSFTELDSLPRGWRKAFGLKLVEELSLALGDLVPKYRITQIKEKYGSLRWYDTGNTKKGYEVIKKYEKKSKVTCVICGKKARRQKKLFDVPLCREHQKGKK